MILEKTPGKQFLIDFWLGKGKSKIETFTDDFPSSNKG